MPRGMGFYERAMEAAEALDFAAALELDDVRDEIALARVMLRDMYEDVAADPEVLLKAAELVGKLAAIQFRITSKPDEGLSKSLANVVGSLGELLHTGGG